MGFCIMRMEKLKSGVSLKRAVQHNTRERKPPNADENSKIKNWTSGGTSDEVMALYQGKLPDNVRANAVHAVEVVMTFGKGFNGDAENYLKDCGKWVESVFGKDNTLHIAHHWDETTPHVHALVMPLKDGKLNAKHFIGGHRDRMRELQDDFFENVGKKHGLERGQSVEETKAKHSHHTLAGKITENDVIRKALDVESYHLGERTKSVELREKALEKESARINEQFTKLEEGKAEFKKVFGMKPDDVRKLKTIVDGWDKQTPDGLLVIAKNIRQSGAATVGDYRKANDQERQQTQTRKL